MDNTQLKELIKQTCYNANIDLEDKQRVELIHNVIANAIDGFKQNQTSLEEEHLKTISFEVLEDSTNQLTTELQELLIEKERLDRRIAQKSASLQNVRHHVFDAIEGSLKELLPELTDEKFHYLHELKVQAVDILDILEEVTESALITTLEQCENIESTTQQIIKDLTCQTLREGIITSVRIRKVVSSILATAIGVAEASPNQAKALLKGTITGLNEGITQSIKRFKDLFHYTPEEAQDLLIEFEDAQKLYEELHHTDTLFVQIIKAQAAQSNGITSDILNDIVEDMHPELNEMINASRETIEVLSEKVSDLAKEAVAKGKVALEKRDILNDKTIEDAKKKAQHAKKMGIKAFFVATKALGGAIKGAKDAIEKNKDENKPQS